MKRYQTQPRPQPNGPSDDQRFALFAGLTLIGFLAVLMSGGFA